MPYQPYFEYAELEQMFNAFNLEVKLEAKQAANKMIQKVIDEQTRKLIDSGNLDYVRGVVYVSKDYIEYGWFKRSPDNIVI